MKRLSLVIVSLCFSLLSTGCAHDVKVDGKTITKDQFNLYLVKNEKQIEAGAKMATRLALLSVKPEQRERAAKEVYAAAAAINAAVQQQNPSLDAVKLQVAMVLQSQGEYADVYQAVVEAVTDLIEADLATKYAEAPPEGRLAATLALVRGSTSGIMAACGGQAKP